MDDEITKAGAMRLLPIKGQGLKTLNPAQSRIQCVDPPVPLLPITGKHCSGGLSPVMIPRTNHPGGLLVHSSVQFFLTPVETALCGVHKRAVLRTIFKILVPVPCSQSGSDFQSIAQDGFLLHVQFIQVHHRFSP
jgi:hypothetical protein